MILEKIKAALGIGPKRPTVELLISVEKLERRMTLLENGRMEELQIERSSDRSLAGGIFKGKVRNIEPGLKAMFVDIGAEKNAFLHYWDAMPLALDEVETISRGKSKKPKRIEVSDIPRLYPVGSEVIVQVSKGPIGTKGARVTTNISLPGRFVVLMPFTDQFGISRKIADPKERQRLRKILEGLGLPEGMGLIIRTAGEGQKARFFVRDVAFLLQQWEDVQKNMETMGVPAQLSADCDIIDRAVRDFLTDEVERVWIDDEASYKRICDRIATISKRSVRKVKLYQDRIPLFEKFNVHRQIEESFGRQVTLKSGASIIIDETEALVAIDVNTGKTRVSDKEDTILSVNLEAAEEVARQLRLRNIGGIIIIDFIDMRSRKDQKSVFDRLKQALSRDKARTHALPISQLGLVEMTRQRTDESVSRTIYDVCPYCQGRGVVKSTETMSLEIQRQISSIRRAHPDAHDLRIIVHPAVLDRLRTQDEELLVDLERRVEARLSFRADPAFAVEEFKVVDATSEKDLTPMPEAEIPRYKRRS